MSRGGSNSPPEASRFVKGRSGNPKGRPKSEKTKAESDFDVVIDKVLTVTQGGVTREVTVEEALQHQTYQAAIAGNRAARREVLKMTAKREKYLASREAPRARKIELLQEFDPGDAEAALLMLGIARQDPSRTGPDYTTPHLLLEVWAVQAALSRRRGGRSLTETERDEIMRRTHDADTLRWPRGSGR